MSLVVSDDTLIKFMTDGVLLKEVEKVGRYIVQLVLLGVSIGMLLQSWRITRREFCGSECVVERSERERERSP